MAPRIDQNRGSTTSKKFMKTKHLTCNITVNLTAEKPTKRRRGLNPVTRKAQLNPCHS